MEHKDIHIQSLRRPDISNPSTKNRQSFIRGWNEAVNDKRLETADAGEDNWRTVGWSAGNVFGKQEIDFRYKLFLWTANQRRLALGLSVLDRLVDE